MKAKKQTQISKKPDIAYFVVRVGGWDGIALQAQIWLDLLLSLKKNIRLVTGEVETGPGPINQHPYNKIETVKIPQMSLNNQKILYKLSFNKRYNQEVWLDRFVSEKKILKREFKKLIKDVPIVFLHNFSIKHLIPTAWAAMYELMTEYKDKRFISISADSPYERTYLMEKFSYDVLRILGKPGLWSKKNSKTIAKKLNEFEERAELALPGPDMLPNLTHIVLNSYQRKVYHNIYGISQKQLYAIPDIGKFSQKGKKQKCTKCPHHFFEYLAKHQITNVQEKLDDKYVYFVSPVRPIKRKKLREIAYICKLFEHFLKGKREKRKVVMVVTHPIREEKPYFRKFKRFAKSLNLTFIHLGPSLMLRKKKSEKDVFTYSEIMRYFSGLKSVCIVGSEIGGWENGILEATEYKIPVCVNPLLPSFQDMNAFGYNYVTAPITTFYDLRKTEFSPIFLKFPSVDTFFKKIYLRIFRKKVRKRNVTHNYSIGLKVQSKKVVKPIIKNILEKS